MKRFFIAVFCIVLACLLCSCRDSSENNKINQHYVGEWKANQISSVMDGKTTYKTVSILLNEDGTGSYTNKEGTWKYQENHTLVLTLTNESIGLVLEIDEEDGKTVLKYYQDIFYRAEEFEAK